VFCIFLFVCNPAFWLLYINKFRLLGYVKKQMDSSPDSSRAYKPAHRPSKIIGSSAVSDTRSVVDKLSIDLLCSLVLQSTISVISLECVIVHSCQPFLLYSRKSRIPIIVLTDLLPPSSVYAFTFVRLFVERLIQKVINEFRRHFSRGGVCD